MQQMLRNQAGVAMNYNVLSAIKDAVYLMICSIAHTPHEVLAQTPLNFHKSFVIEYAPVI